MSSVESLAGQRLSFIEPFDGVVRRFSDAELEATVEAFNSSVDQTLLAHPANVEVSRYTTRPNDTYLHLSIDFPDKSIVSIGLTTRESALGSLLLCRQVSITELDTSTQFVRSHDYKFKPGILEVTRHDIYASSQEENELVTSDEHLARQKKLLASMSAGEIADEAGKIVDQLAANQDLEKEMGYNHLPVGLAEVKSINTLISEAKP